ncbi:hypothetical protein EDB81DRAFT_715893 [Dactylonectria macrodidyma]|uniref:Uncharacterized protein n=1 Tax=Dactylonectria macrodidyma TaxID=307937 RepID=A0A9P9F5S4_9HYPO|nr:hypothetical protein EDB81DRAFT_715893 [Dactylonectria macrodidyma]
MHFQSIFIIFGFFQLFFGTAQCQTCTNVTIASADDAAQIRNNCTTITGWLRFSEGLNETINLDGVESVNGDITHEGDDEEYDELGPYPNGSTIFQVHSSTLKTVNGSIKLWAFNGLDELRFPNLTRVEYGFSLRRMGYLKLLDITKLTRLGYLSIQAPHLTTIQHESFEGFTGTYSDGGSLSFSAAGVESLDSWFKNPLTVRNNTDPSDWETRGADVDISGYLLPNLKNITIGWANISKVEIDGNDGFPSVIFGGPETETMEIDLLILPGNVSVLARGPVLEELKIGELLADHGLAEELDLSAFDKVATLTIRDNYYLKYIRLPPSAVDWEDLALSINSNPELMLTSEYRDEEDKTDRFWYWPKGEIRLIQFYYNPIGNDFFTSFLQDRNSSNASKVTESFGVGPEWYSEEDKPHFDCTPFQELVDRSVIPKDGFRCRDYSSAASVTAEPIVWSVTAIALLMSVIHIL